MKMILRIEDKGKKLFDIQAIGDNGVQYEIIEIIYTKQSGKAAAAIKHGVIARGKNEDDKTFAIKMLQEATKK